MDPFIKRLLRPAVLTARRLKREGLSLSDVGHASPRSFSQFGEDIWLDHYFGDQKDGFYVDVGAFHPFHLSNTRRLSRRGWTGINIEPSVEAANNFRRSRPRDVTLQVAVSSASGAATFVEAGTFAGLEDDQYLWPQSSGERLSVETVPLADIFEQHLPNGRLIDLLDVDCEGHDLTVLQSNDWERYRSRIVLCEEHGQAETNVGDFMMAKGYRLLTRLHLTCIYEDELQVP